MTITLIAGCGKEAEDDTSSSSSTSSGNNPTLGVVQDDAFYVRVFDEEKFPYYMSKLGDFNTKCAIASGSSAQNLDCVLDMNELDLYFHGVSFQYNVPSGMCSYFSRSTYWYYNYEVGYGPSTFVRNETKDASGNLVSSSCVIDGVTQAGCSNSESSYGTDGPSCIYNYTASGGPNCCMGSYTKTVNTTTPSGTTSTSEVLGWGGNYAGCIGGAGKTNWTELDKVGKPVGVIEYTPSTGLNQKYDVTGPQFKSNTGLNIPIANFYTASKHTHGAYVGSTTSSYPYIVDPIDDRSGSPLPSGNPAYTWTCYDRNLEIVNRIRVYIREWNTNKEFVKYGTTSGASGDPDISGFEGTECDYTSSMGGRCNDRTDLDDNTFTNYNSTTKPLLFPNEEY
tara:strand:+ start:128854 stop:130035 length:1182 start_codon:yes stop_codon:yes gene_type:complete